MQARPIAPHRASRHPSAGPAAIVAASVQIAAERRERTRARREGRASGKHACQAPGAIEVPMSCACGQNIFDVA